MHRAGTALLGVLLGISLAGCLQAPDCPVPAHARVLTLPVPAAYLATDPAQAWDTLSLAWPSSEGPVDARYEADGGWRVATRSYAGSPAGNGPHAPTRERVPVEGGDRAATLRRSWSLAHEQSASSGACHSGRSGAIAWDLKAPRAGQVAQPGNGVRVMTAGFWENGTLFYTNIRQLHASAWPRAAWYSWESGEALPVYVYDKDRSERGPLWHATTAGTAAGSPTGNATVWDYFTTIPGFNNALKGLSTNTARVVRLAPEDAYTRPGQEKNPLYGAALVFYIKILDVDRLPCPNVGMMCAMDPNDGVVAGGLAGTPT